MNNAAKLEMIIELTQSGLIPVEVGLWMLDSMKERTLVVKKKEDGSEYVCYE